jgi:hypothetical protein
MNQDKAKQLSEKTKLCTQTPWIHFSYVLLNQIHLHHGQCHPVPVKKETLIIMARTVTLTQTKKMLWKQSSHLHNKHASITYM